MKFCKIIVLIVFMFLPYVANAQMQKVVRLNYCDAFKSENEGKLLRLKAFMSYTNVSRVDGGDTHLFSNDCNNGDYFAVAEIDIQPKKSPFNKLLDSLRREDIYTFEVEFIGKLETTLQQTFGHLAWSRAKMQITNVLAIKNVTKRKIKADYNADTPIINLGFQLTHANRALLSLLFESKNFTDFVSKSKIEFQTFNEFFFEQTNGKNENLENSIELVQSFFNVSQMPKSYFFELGTITRNDKSYFVSGFFGYKTENNKLARLSYKNEFTLSSNSWTLKSVTISKPD